MTDQPDTPSRLVAAAERLFAEGGEAATSLRAVARLAHANAAAVHYHFGGRDELLRAVFDRHLGPVAERQLRLLAEAGRAEPPTVAGILTAYLRPDLELLAKLRKHRVEIARFLGRARLERTHLGVGPADDADELALTLLRRAVPEVDAAELAVRLELVRLSVAALLAGAPAATSPGPLGGDDVDDQLRRLVAFAEAGLTAPAPRTRGRKRRKNPS